MRFLTKFIYFNILGWKVKGNVSFSTEKLKKCIIIPVPHTSWHDFYIGILLRSVCGVNTSFLAKKELFFFPLSIILKWLNFTPVDRFKKGNKVDKIASIFSEHSEFRIGLAPEGTRAKVDKLRTGFYHIAKKANIPIIMVTLDYKNKTNTISEPFHLTNDITNDFKFIESFFKGIEGKVKDRSFN